MRGELDENAGMFSYITPAQRVPKDHPLRAIRDAGGRGAEGDVARLSAAVLADRPAVDSAGEADPSFGAADAVHDPQRAAADGAARTSTSSTAGSWAWEWTTGCGIRRCTRRTVRGCCAARSTCASSTAVLEQAREKGLLSEEHFTVDGTLIEAWASQKSFQPKDRPKPPSDDPGNPSVDFRGQKRTNETHESKTDPQSRLFRKARGHEAKLCYMGHVLMENRNGLAVAGMTTIASGYAERDAALELIEPRTGGSRLTLGADKAYDTADFVEALRDVAGDSPRGPEHHEPFERDRRKDDTPSGVRSQPEEAQGHLTRESHPAFRLAGYLHAISQA